MPPEHPQDAESPQRPPSIPLLVEPEGAPPQTISSSFLERGRDIIPRRMEGSPSRKSFSSSLNQKTPARSFYHHRSTNDSSRPVDITQDSSRDVREETAELASWALSDIVSPSRRRLSSPHSSVDAVLNDELNHRTSNDSTRISDIPELSEPASPQNEPISGHIRSTSALTSMIHRAPSSTEDSQIETEDGIESTNLGVQPVTVREGIISQPNERTSLLLMKKVAYGSDSTPKNGSVDDLEGQGTFYQQWGKKVEGIYTQSKRQAISVVRTVEHPKAWDSKGIFNYVVQTPAGYLSPIILGLLLNVLDALSYGMILFPLGEPMFADLGPDGISMFYVSCIVAQLVYSLNGSMFKGAVGSEMIEVVPFFHKMAFTVLNRVGRENPEAVIATTILSYSLSSILTGAVFFIMGKCHLGALIGFFPGHILIGCIGGVGWFLVATGLEVSARLDGNLEYTLPTLRKLFELETIPLWTIPLVLAIILHFTKKRINHPSTDAVFFISIIAVFYFFTFAVEPLNLPDLRTEGWVFEAPEAGVPFYHFYSLYNFGAVDWAALGATVPAMLALTFFGVLHVPINVPALAMQTGEDNVDVDRELRAHGISNALSGVCGSIQNYLVYTNTVMFMRSGGNHRSAGVLLAVATCGILVAGPVLIGFIPIMVVGALIFYLGMELLEEALIASYRKVHRLEYATIIIIIVTMGAYDFVVGILVGIVLACVSYVIQSSQISAIRGSLHGGVANSTVRRHPIQHRYLQDAGQQIHVMKLGGHLFFGTIVGLENQVRRMLDSFQEQPIRFLVLDLYQVDGVDFSAAAAFSRINRLFRIRDVQLVFCGITEGGEVYKSMVNVGLFNEEEDVKYFASLNSALEYCENELLKTFYRLRDAEVEEDSSSAYLAMPIPGHQNDLLSTEGVYGSPRTHHLAQVATSTLSEQNPTQRTKHAQWEEYDQPLQLILQTFSTVSEKPEDFWYSAAPYFTRQAFPNGSVLFKFDDDATGFYLLESGFLQIQYNYPQGEYSEVIVAGTTCGELPFFSDTKRTATAYAEGDCVTWMLDQERWRDMQTEHPRIAQELLTISLKLTSERYDKITRYMLLTSG